jgi:class 3 adenylate cyclase
MTHPTGTVTFLFTDIEGSTKLWREHPEGMKRSHARHNEILRAAIETNNGYIFQVIGDAFCAAFHKAGDVDIYDPMPIVPAPVMLRFTYQIPG